MLEYTATFLGTDRDDDTGRVRSWYQVHGDENMGTVGVFTADDGRTVYVDGDNVPIHDGGRTVDGDRRMVAALRRALTGA